MHSLQYCAGQQKAPTALSRWVSKGQKKLTVARGRFKVNKRRYIFIQSLLKLKIHCHRIPGCFACIQKPSLMVLWNKNPPGGSQDKDTISGSGIHRVPSYWSQKSIAEEFSLQACLIKFFLKHLLLVIIKERVGGWTDLYPDPLQLLFLVHTSCKCNIFFTPICQSWNRID